MTPSWDIEPMNRYVARAMKNQMPAAIGLGTPSSESDVPLNNILIMNRMPMITITARKTSTNIWCTFDLVNIDAFRWGVGITTHTRFYYCFTANSLANSLNATRNA